MVQRKYTAKISGRAVELPVLTLPSGISIAFFNLHGDTELTEFCAEHLAPLIADADVILTAESKGLQLAHCTARILGHPRYAVARKSKKLYMQDGIETAVRSITTGDEQKLYLSASDTALLKGKNVAIVDDVISTGSSLIGLETLVQSAQGAVYKKACVLVEGDAADRTDILFLGTIPILS